jgi:hypothetical protein
MGDVVKFRGRGGNPPGGGKPPAGSGEIPKYKQEQYKRAAAKEYAREKIDLYRPKESDKITVRNQTRAAAARPVDKGVVNGWKINSGKYAYQNKPTFAGNMARGAGMVARGAMRAAGPAGALVGMTSPAGAGSDKPVGSPMRGNSPGVGRGPGGGSLNAPARTAPSRSSTPSYGGGARDSGRTSTTAKTSAPRGTERFAKGSLVKSKVNQAGVYTKPGMRKKMFESIKASATHGTKAGQWSARKAQLLAKNYKAAGGGYKKK